MLDTSPTAEAPARTAILASARLDMQQIFILGMLVGSMRGVGEVKQKNE